MFLLFWVLMPESAPGNLPSTNFIGLKHTRCKRSCSLTVISEDSTCMIDHWISTPLTLLRTSCLAQGRSGSPRLWTMCSFRRHGCAWVQPCQLNCFVVCVCLQHEEPEMDEKVPFLYNSFRDVPTLPRNVRCYESPTKTTHLFCHCRSSADRLQLGFGGTTELRGMCVSAEPSWPAALQGVGPSSRTLASFVFIILINILINIIVYSAYCVVYWPRNVMWSTRSKGMKERRACWLANRLIGSPTDWFSLTDWMTLWDALVQSILFADVVISWSHWFIHVLIYCRTYLLLICFSNIFSSDLLNY